MNREQWKARMARKRRVYCTTLQWKTGKTIALDAIDWIDSPRISIPKDGSDLKYEFIIHFNNGTKDTIDSVIEKKTKSVTKKRLWFQFWKDKEFNVDVPYVHQDYFEDKDSIKKNEEFRDFICKEFRTFKIYQHSEK